MARKESNEPVNRDALYLQLKQIISRAVDEKHHLSALYKIKRRIKILISSRKLTAEQAAQLEEQMVDIFRQRGVRTRPKITLSAISTRISETDDRGKLTAAITRVKRKNKGLTPAERKELERAIRERRDALPKKNPIYTGFKNRIERAFSPYILATVHFNIYKNSTLTPEEKQTLQLHINQKWKRFSSKNRRGAFERIRKIQQKRDVRLKQRSRSR